MSLFVQSLPRRSQMFRSHRSPTPNAIPSFRIYGTACRAPPIIASFYDASAQVRVPRALGSALTSLFPWELGGVQGTVGKLSASPL